MKTIIIILFALLTLGCSVKQNMINQSNEDTITIYKSSNGYIIKQKVSNWTVTQWVEDPNGTIVAISIR